MTMDIRPCLLITSLSEALEILQEMACSGTVPDIHTGRAHPTLNFLKGDRDVLGIVPIETPEFTASGGLWNTMAIVIDNDSILLGSLSCELQILSKIIKGRIHDTLVVNFDAKALELVGDIGANGIGRIVGRQ